MNVKFHILSNTSSFLYSARQNKGNESGRVQRLKDGETKEAFESYTAVLTGAEPRVKANVKESLPLDCFAPFAEPTSPCAGFLLCCDIGGACPAWLCSQGCFLAGAWVPRGELSFSSQPLDDDPSQPTKNHPLGTGLSLDLLHKSVVWDTWLSLTPPAVEPTRRFGRFLRDGPLLRLGLVVIGRLSVPLSFFRRAPR